MQVRKAKAPVMEKYLSKTTLYVGNLNYKRDEDQLKQLFFDFGYVESVKFVLNPKTKLKTGIAFVVMPKDGQAEKAVRALNGKVIDGRTLKVSFANARIPETFKKPIAAKEKTQQFSNAKKPTQGKRPAGLAPAKRPFKKSPNRSK